MFNRGYLKGVLGGETIKDFDINAAFDSNFEACVLEYDRRLFDIEKQLNILRYVNPVNAGREKGKFLKAYATGKTYDPFFEYESPGPEVRAFSRKLKRIKGKLENCRASFFAPYYIEKIDTLLELADLFEHRDHPAFGTGLASVFGKPTRELVREARRNLRRLNGMGGVESVNGREGADVVGGIYGMDSANGTNDTNDTNGPETLDSLAVRKIFEAELRAFGLEWEVRPFRGGGARIAVNSARGEVYVDFSARFSENNIKRYLFHEIRTHVFRAENGKRQPFRIFLSGFPGFRETEEGLAVYNEYDHGLLDPETLKKYSARVIAASMVPISSFSEIFEEMLQYFPPEEAFTITQRVKRGLSDTSLPGGYPKDYVYLGGFMKVSAFLQASPSKAEALKVLYCGKIGLDNFDLARDLLERGILKPPRYLPEMELPAQNAVL